MSEALDLVGVCKRHLLTIPCACGKQKMALKVSVIGTPEAVKQPYNPTIDLITICARTRCDLCGHEQKFAVQIAESTRLKEMRLTPPASS